jgi:hypothetical protein
MIFQVLVLYGSAEEIAQGMPGKVDRHAQIGRNGEAGK